MINLLSDEIKKARHFARMNVVMVQYTILVAIAITAMSGLMLYGQSTLNDTKSKLEDQIATNRARAAALEPINKEAEELSATINTIGTLIDQEVKFSVVLDEIAATLPRGVVLSAITLSQDTTKPIVLDVSLLNEERSAVLLQNLIDSDLFVSADLLNINRSPQTGGYQFVGQVQAYFNPDLPLNTLDDPVAEEAQTTQDTEATPTEEPGGPIDEGEAAPVDENEGGSE